MQGRSCVRQIECQQQPLFGGESPGFVEFFLLELLPELTGAPQCAWNRGWFHDSGFDAESR
jgi:hypothetical protein